MAQEQTGTPGSISTGSGEKLAKVPHCTVVPYPKVVFFYPLMCAALVCGFLQATNARGADGSFLASNAAGTIFIIVFLINILVISFDFPGIKALALFFGVIALVLGVMYVDSLYDHKVLHGLGKVAKSVHQMLGATPAFYFLVSGILASMIFGGILVNWLWNRWVVEPTRLYHRHGLLGELTEYPVIDLQMDKKIEDVFEYALLLSGTMTFKPNANSPLIRLENVPRINAKELKIQRIVRKIAN